VSENDLRLLTLEGKEIGVLMVAQRVEEQCIGLPDAESWAFKTGQIIGELLKEINQQKRELE
jgi:hypothetical protein